MSVPNCYAKVSALMKTMGRKVSEADLRDMAVQLAEKRLDLLSTDDFNVFAQELYINRMLREAAAIRTQKLMNLQTITAAKEAVMQPIEGMTLSQKLDTYILGNSRRIGNAMNRSVEHGKATLVADWMRGLRSALEKTDDLQVAETGLLAREVTQEMAALEKGGSGSVSGSSNAYRIAKAYHGVMAHAFEMKQAFDPFLGKIQDYFHRASHDIRKVSSVSRDEWVAFAMQKYGKNSFPELVGEKKVEAFANVYDQISKGYYETALEFDADGPDIMRKMAARRTLIPNDWQSFHDYNIAFGRDNVHTAVVRALESAAHDLSVMSKFGSQPEKTFNGLMSELLRSGSKADIEEIKVNKRKFEDHFKAVTQRSASLAVGQGAKWVRGVLSWNQLAKNSAALLRSWQDVANMTTVLTDTTGGSYLGNMVEAVTSYAKFFGSNKTARNEALQDKFLFARSGLHNFYEEFGGNAQVMGDTKIDKFNAWMSKALEVQSNITLMDRHISAIDAAMATVISRRLGRMTELGHAQLDVQTQGALKRYGINAPEWEAIRQGVEDWSSKPGIESAMGPMDRMLTVDGILSISDEALEKYARDSGRFTGKGSISKPALIRARTELELAVGSLINDHANAASSTAGAAERAFLYRNADPNSATGMGLRLLFQFKSALVKNYDTMMRSKYSNPLKPQGDKTRVARHIILASSLWAVGDTAKTLFEGKTADPLETPESKVKFASRALLESGAGGLFGDAVFSEVVRNGEGNIAEGALRSLAGPTFSGGADVIHILGKLGYSMNGESFPGNKIAKVVSQNIPLQNLFYAKSAMNYFLLNEIREWGSAGYMNRMDQRANEQGQEFNLPSNRSFWSNP